MFVDFGWRVVRVHAALKEFKIAREALVPRVPI